MRGQQGALSLAARGYGVGGGQGQGCVVLRLKAMKGKYRRSQALMEWRNFVLVVGSNTH